MLIELLNDCIIEMKEVHKLEEISREKEYHDRLEKSFRKAIEENNNIMDKIKILNQKAEFSLASDIINLELNLLDEVEKRIIENSITEDFINYISNINKNLSEKISMEWKVFYSNKTSMILSMLETIRDIAQDRKTIDYTIGKIQKGKYWRAEENEIDLYVRGMNDAKEIITELDLNESEIEFLKKVTSGSATVDDLSDSILEWIRSSNIGQKLRIRFV